MHNLHACGFMAVYVKLSKAHLKVTKIELVNNCFN